MNLGEFVDGKAQQPLPKSLIDHEAELDKFQKYCHSLMLKILVLFAIGLEVNRPYPITFSPHFSRLMKSLAAQIGFPPVIAVQAQVDAPSGSSTTLQSHPEPITNPPWTSEPVPILTTDLSLSSFSERASLV